MHLSLDEWDTKIKHHLAMIEHYAWMCERHVDELIFRPDFETRAAGELGRIEHVLAVALTRVRSAQANYESKEVGY